jgi:site-specific DNA recombinase
MSTKQGTKQAAIYCRISMDREGAGLGVERQREDCQALADSLGWAVAKVYVDNDLSAFSGKTRPGYKAMLSDLASGAVNAVIVWHTDRLHRSPRELEAYIDICEPRGVVTQTVRAGELDLATPSGRMIARQLGVIARYESEHLAERVKRKQLQGAQEGLWHGGTLPLGWNFHADKSVTLDKVAARHIKEATADIVSGVSIGSIVTRWNEAGFRTGTGRPWRHSAVREVLTRPRNAGLVSLNGEVMGKSQWPAIVDENAWRALVAVVGDPARRRSQSNRVKWLVVGIATCGAEGCGKPLSTSAVPMRSGGKRTVYRCTARGPGHVYVNAVDLDKFVTDEVLRIRRSPGYWQHFNAPETKDETRLAALRNEARSISVRLESAPTDFANDPNITPAMLSNIVGQLKEKLVAVEGERDKLAASVHRIDLDPADIERAWRKLSIEQQRQVIRETLTALVVLPADRGGRREFNKSRVIFGVDWEALPGPEDFEGMA